MEINAPDNEALNLGQILASSGRIGIFAGLVRNNGTLNADRAVAGPAGEIMLKATTNVIVQGPISAIDGKISIEAGGSATLEGAGALSGGDIVLTGGGAISIGSPVTGSGSVNLQTTGGGGTVLSVVASSAPSSGGVIVNGITVPMSTFSSLGPAGGGFNFGAIAAAFQSAARALHFGTGQVVGSLLTTSQINDLPLGVGSAFGTLAPARASLLFE